jgi:hypothetical protein
VDLYWGHPHLQHPAAVHDRFRIQFRDREAECRESRQQARGVIECGPDEYVEIAREAGAPWNASA